MCTVHYDAAWTRWVYASNASTTITSGGVWGYWTSNAVTATAANTNITWTIWASAESGNSRTWQREQAKRQRDQKKATLRATRLLRRHLTRKQRADFARERAFKVIVGERTYRIRRGIAGNVDLIDAEGRELERLCIHPHEAVPEEDNMLAQKLMLEHDEASFRRIANITPLRRTA